MALKFNIVANIISGLFTIASECRAIFKIPNEHVLLHGLSIEFQNWDWDKEDKAKKIKSLSDHIIHHFIRINELIDLLNRNLILLNEDLEDVKIKKINIQRNVLHKNLSSIFQEIRVGKGLSDKLMPHIKNSVYILLKSFTEPVMNGCNEVVRSISPRGSGLLKSVTIPSIYQKRVNEVVDLYILGYKTTSLLVLGKIFEEIFSKQLMRLKRINVIDLSTNKITEMKFHTKLNTLYAKQFIHHKDWLLLSKLIWDRNIGGHNLGKRKEKEASKEAEATIRLILPLISKYCEKAKKI